MLAAGTRVGPYEVLSALGSGGMGVVYRARDTRLGRDVAIKVMGEAARHKPMTALRFEREARLAGSLNHPNVLAIYDVGEHAGAPYLVTELLQGETVRARLARGPLPLREAVWLGLQIAQGLGAAHDKGIVHRDLKPDNLFVLEGGRVKILDFGIATLAAPESRGGTDSVDREAELRTASGTVLGTPAYMSPEQLRGEPVDARADLFSFGCVLHELVCGTRPFAGRSGPELSAAILKEEPAPLPPGTPEPLARLVSRCLKKPRDERLSSAAELAAELEALAATLSAPGTRSMLMRAPPSGLSALWGELRRRRVFRAVAALLCLGLLGALPGVAWELLRTPAQRPNAAQQLTAQPLTPQQVTPQQVTPQSLTPQPPAPPAPPPYQPVTQRVTQEGTPALAQRVTHAASAPRPPKSVAAAARPKPAREGPALSRGVNGAGPKAAEAAPPDPRVARLQDLLAARKLKEVVAEGETMLQENPPPALRGAVYRILTEAYYLYGDDLRALRFAVLYREYCPAPDVAALDGRIARLRSDLGMTPAQ